MNQADIHQVRTNASLVGYTLHVIVFTAIALIFSSVTAMASVRQVIPAHTPDAHCSQNPDMSVTCDPLPQSLTVNFNSTLADSKLILLATWTIIDNGDGQGPHGSMGGCVDNLGQNWLGANGQSVKITPPANATIAGITSITCQTAFPDPPLYYGSPSTGKWGVLILHFFEVTGALPQDVMSSFSPSCSALPATNQVTILTDYTDVVQNGTYNPSPILGDYGVLGPETSGALLLDDPNGISDSQILNSMYAAVGTSPAMSPMQYPNATKCLTLTIPQHVTAETGINLGVCDQCENDAGQPLESAAGEPINLTNGNVYIKQDDYVLPGLSGGITLNRTWNSLWRSTPHGSIPQARMFGDSWTSSYEDCLLFIDSQTVDYFRGDGNKARFRFDVSIAGTNVYVITAPIDRRLSLYFDIANNTWSLEFNGSFKNFDSLGRLISVQDRNRNFTTLTYSQNRLTQITDAASRQITFTYGDLQNPNQVTAVGDVVGTIAMYNYDTSGRLVQVTYADGAFNRFNYDANSFILSVTDTDSKVLESHTYDQYGRGLTSARAGGVESFSVSYSAGGVAHLTDSMGRLTDYGSSAIHERNVMNTISGSGCATCGGRSDQTFFYDTDGNRTSSQDALLKTTTFQYDALGHITQRSITVNGTPVTWHFTYYSNYDEISSITDPLGHVTTNTFDSNGNMLTTTAPPIGGRTPPTTTSFTYDTKGQLLTVTDPLNHVTTFTYTAAGLVHTITDAQNKVTQFEYDSRGNRTTIIDAIQQPTTFAYDLRNRLTSVTYPTTPQTSTAYTYDSRGRRTSVTDANGKTTTFGYDDADRLITVTDAQTPAGVTHYEYDSESNLINVTDALGRITHYEYDAQGRVTSTTFPSLLIETYSYDAVGNMTGKTDRNQHNVSYSYDELGRRTRKQYPDQTQVNYSYDAASRLTQVTDPTGTYQFTYDPMGRLTQTSTAYSFITGHTFTVGYAWDVAANLISMTDPQNGSTTYTYDTLNRLLTLKNPQRNQFSFTYDALGRRTQLARPNSVNTNYQYDPLSRVTSLLHQFTTNKGATTTLDGAQYTYDAAGNRLARTDKRTNVVSNFTYDPLYEVTQVTQGASTVESYSFDAVGNRLSSLGVASYSYNASSELTGQGSTSYGYDSNGNLITAGSTTYSWDFENRLTQVMLPGGSQVNFKYDPMGRRIQKSSSSGTVNYVYDGANTLEEVNASGALVTRYTQAPGVDQILAILNSGATNYYEADAQGTITSLSNSSGLLASTYTYDSFGKLTASSGTAFNTYRYTGRESDSETGLYYDRARYYDPSVGRFISEDPILFEGGMDFYAYVSNNSVNRIDPLGLCPLSETPWYKNSCITGAIGNGLLHVGIDAIGLIPEGGIVSRAIGNYAGFRGVVATQQGTKALQGVKMASGIGSTGLGSTDTSGSGLIASGLGVAGIVTTLAGATPVVGQALSVVSIGVDLYNLRKEIKECK
jgi:RHS repeat-associated protein